MTFELTDAEHKFLTAAVDCFIPADNLTPSGSDCGVVDFIATQLAGEWGAGARLYRDGPIQKGKPEHGYQLGLTPRELFRVGIAGANAYCRRAYGKDFAAMDDAGRNAALTAMESGSAASDDFPAKDATLGAFNIAVTQAPDGGMRIERVPVVAQTAEQQQIIEEMK